MTQAEMRKERYAEYLKEGKDPKSSLMQNLANQIALDERKEHLDKLEKEDRERWSFLMQNPFE